MENKRDTSKNVESEIIIYQTEDGHTKIDVNLKMRLFGLHRHNYVNSIKRVNLISASISKHIFGESELEENSVVRNSEQLLADGKKI